MSKTSTTVKSGADWKRLKAMREEDIDYSDAPKITPEMFAKGLVKKRGVVVRRVKQSVTHASKQTCLSGSRLAARATRLR